MALKKELVGSGIWGGSADAINGSVVTGITAYAGGGQTNAVVLSGAVNVIGTCATAADSVKLPVASAGDEVWVRNNGAASSNVFPQSGGKINNGTGDAAVACAASKTMVFKCIGGVDWVACLTA